MLVQGDDSGHVVVTELMQSNLSWQLTNGYILHTSLNFSKDKSEYLPTDDPNLDYLNWGFIGKVSKIRFIPFTKTITVN
jgi:hypothetical protein